MFSRCATRDDRIDARTLHADACAYRVDTLVGMTHGDLGAFAGDADDLLDGDQSVEDFGNLLLEETFENWLAVRERMMRAGCCSSRPT